MSQDEFETLTTQLDCENLKKKCLTLQRSVEELIKQKHEMMRNVMLLKSHNTKLLEQKNSLQESVRYLSLKGLQLAQQFMTTTPSQPEYIQQTQVPKHLQPTAQQLSQLVSSYQQLKGKLHQLKSQHSRCLQKLELQQQQHARTGCEQSEIAVQTVQTSDNNNAVKISQIHEESTLTFSSSQKPAIQTLQIEFVHETAETTQQPSKTQNPEPTTIYNSIKQHFFRLLTKMAIEGRAYDQIVICLQKQSNKMSNAINEFMKKLEKKKNIFGQGTRQVCE